MKKLFIIPLAFLLFVGLGGAFFAPAYGGVLSEGLFSGVSLAFAAPINYVSSEITFDCLYDPAPKVDEPTSFLCTITNATERSFVCHGITRNPSDESVLDIQPEMAVIEDYGFADGYIPAPAGEDTQFVKIYMGTKRLKDNTSVTYEAFCASDDAPALTASYAVNLTPQFAEPFLIPEIYKSTKENAAYVVAAGFGLVLVIAILFLIYRASR